MPMRRTDVRLTRLRIGHTRFTHRHLFWGEDAPLCPSCKESYTVKHILVDCPVFNHYRIISFGSSHLTLTDLVGEIPHQNSYSERRDRDVRRRSPIDHKNRNWSDVEVLDRQNDRIVNYRSTYGNGPQKNHGFENRNRIDRDNREFESHKPGLSHVLYPEIDTGDKTPVVSRPYWYDRVKQGTIDYHVEKMLKEGTIIPIQSPYASPVVLCRKNKGLPSENPKAYSFAVYHHKPNAITMYPRYPLPLIEDLITNIPHTNILSSPYLCSGYFQLAVKPSDVVKTKFVTKNCTFAFKSMPFGLSGAAPNFQKGMDIILKPVLGCFVSVHE
ncbi:retrovirus-related Pol polyprotein from transposon opus [Trichonephila clavipes]|nr:retrovirus-related Pol polyprotein from transposon opus [Trichonephila clavipes]